MKSGSAASSVRRALAPTHDAKAPRRAALWSSNRRYRDRSGDGGRRRNIGGLRLPRRLTASLTSEGRRLIYKSALSGSACGGPAAVALCRTSARRKVEFNARPCGRQKVANMTAGGSERPQYGDGKLWTTSGHVSLRNKVSTFTQEYSIHRKRCVVRIGNLRTSSQEYAGASGSSTPMPAMVSSSLLAVSASESLPQHRIST